MPYKPIIQPKVPKFLSPFVHKRTPGKYRQWSDFTECERFIVNSMHSKYWKHVTCPECLKQKGRKPNVDSD